MPNEPVKPRGKMTAYAFFVQICREEHKKKFPDEKVDFAEFSRKCTDRWKTMSDIEKKRFNMLAESDKRRFEAEMNAYNAITDGGKSKKAKKTKDPLAPKRPMGPYFLFMNEKRDTVREEHPDMPFKDVTKLIGSMWKEIEPKEKQKYEQMAADEHDRYKHEKAAYDKKKADEMETETNSDDDSQEIG